MTRSGLLSGVTATGGALVAVVAAGVGPWSTVAGVAGLALLVAGLLRRTRALVTLGAGGLGGAVLLAGVDGASAAALVGATAAAVLAWTVGQTSVELGAHGRATRTGRFEATHVAGTGALLVVAAGVALAPRVLRPEPSPLGLALVLVGGVALTGALLADA